MTKFKDMKYIRPDFKQIKADYQQLISDFQKAKKAQDQIKIIDKGQNLAKKIETLATLVSIRNSINVKDEFYDQEQNWWDEISPELADLDHQFDQAIVSSSFKIELAEEFGQFWLDKIELNLKTFSPAIIADLKIENKLESDYQKLVGSAQIDWRGEKLNISQMAPLMQDLNRKVRKQAHEALSQFFAVNEAKFDQIYDDLVKIRTKIAHKLGYDNFVQLGYERMGRLDYDAKMVADYRQQILTEIVPLDRDLVARQQKRLGLNDFYYYDASLKFKSGNARPKGDVLLAASQMYQGLSPETDDFWQMMIKNDLLDVEAKDGKAPGGYCTMILDYQMPFIFANFNQTAHDVVVMTHETGHAFQSYQSKDARLASQIWPTMEACEIHSMSMEFLTWPWMNLFFKDEADKFRFSHLASALSFLPYGAAVDEFQTWVYQNPTKSPTDRKAFWRQLEQKYLPDINYSDNDFLERGGFWFRQGHIFSSPFYYIDYTLAQICALEFWQKDLKNHEQAWADYLRLCRAGGDRSFLDLVKLAKIDSPFKEGVLAKIAKNAKAYLDKIDDSEF